MPKLKKLSTAKLSTAVKDASNDIYGFCSLFAQSKDIIGNHLKNNKAHFDWLSNIFQEAQARIEDVQKDFASDTSQLDEVGDAGGKESGHTVLFSQENGGNKKRKKNAKKDSSSDISQLDGLTDTSNLKVSSFQENGGPKTRRKKRSSKLHKSSATSQKVAPVKSSSKNNNVDHDEDKENINENASFKTDTSQDIIVSSSSRKPRSSTQVRVGTPSSVKANDTITVLEPAVTFDQSSESIVNHCHQRTTEIQLRDKVQEDPEAIDGSKLRESVVVLERLTNGKSSNQYSVPLNDHYDTPVKNSQENELKTTRTSSSIICRDSVVVLKPLVVMQCTELDESAVQTSNRRSSKRKLTEVCESSDMVSESISGLSETRRSSRTSNKSHYSMENLEPVSKMPKLSHVEKSFSSEENEDNGNKMPKPHVGDSDSADSGTCCVGSSGESGNGSQGGNTSMSSSSAKESLTALKNWQFPPIKKNDQLNRQRSQESIGYKTPENSNLKKDFNYSTLRLQSYKPMLSQSRTTPKSTFVFSSSKMTNQLSKSKLLNGSHSTKPCTPLFHGMNTSIFKSQVAAVHEAEKEKQKQEEARRQQEKEQAVLKKQQLLQMRVEEQKRKREARMQKNLEARQQLDREKAERQKVIEQKEKKISSVAKEKAKEVKKTRLKTESSDDCGLAKKLCSAKLTDKVLHTPMDAAKMHYKEALSAKPVVSVIKHITSETAKSSENKSTKPSEPQAAVLNSTFVKSDETPCESYEMTPARPRSTYCSYDISELKSDDESDNESAPTKPIPSWAVGMRFKQALISQHHNPPNLEKLFGAAVAPDLSEVFAVQRNRYLRRTSSAVWNTPDKIVFAVKSYS